MENKPHRLIYGAGKLNGDACGYITNAHDLTDYCNDVYFEAKNNKDILTGVHNPANDFIAGFLSGKMTYEDFWLNNCIVLERSDAIALAPNWRNSPGAKAEKKVAEKLGKEVLESWEDVENYIGNGND